MCLACDLQEVAERQSAVEAAVSTMAFALIFLSFALLYQNGAFKGVLRA